MSTRKKKIPIRKTKLNTIGIDEEIETKQKPTVLGSGHKQEFETGSKRDNQIGKGMPSLLQFMALIEVSKVSESGAVRYGKDNWRKGQPISRYLDSALRHLVKFTCNWQDEPHIEQCIWNLLCIKETKMMIALGKLPKSLDDIPNEFFEDENMANIMKDILGWV